MKVRKSPILILLIVVLSTSLTAQTEGFRRGFISAVSSRIRSVTEQEISMAENIINQRKTAERTIRTMHYQALATQTKLGQERIDLDRFGNSLRTLRSPVVTPLYDQLRALYAGNTESTNNKLRRFIVGSKNDSS